MSDPSSTVTSTDPQPGLSKDEAAEKAGSSSCSPDPLTVGEAAVPLPPCDSPRPAGATSVQMKKPELRPATLAQLLDALENLADELDARNRANKMRRKSCLAGEITFNDIDRQEVGG